MFKLENEKYCTLNMKIAEPMMNKLKNIAKDNDISLASVIRQMLAQQLRIFENSQIKGE